MATRNGSSVSTYRAIALAVLLLAFALGVFKLEAQSLWWDEGYSIDLSAKGLIGITVGTSTDIHPPLYYYILWAWMLLTGQTEFAVRFLSLGFGVAIVALVASVGRRLFDWRVGLLAMLFAAANPFRVVYSQEARMYTMEGFLGLLATYLLLRLLAADIPRRRLVWAAYALTIALALYADYFSVYITAFHGTYVLTLMVVGTVRRSATTSANASFLLRWLASQVVAAALYAPWLGIGMLQVATYGYGIITAPPFAAQLTQLWNAFVLGSMVEPRDAWGYLVFVAVLSAVGAVVGLSAKGGWPLSSVVLAIFYLVVPFAAFLATMLLRPFFNPRYLFVVMPAVPLLAAMACATLWRWSWGRIVGAVLVVVVLAGFAVGLRNYFFDPTWAKDDARAVIAYIESQAQADDLVVWETPHPFSYYYRGVAEAGFLRTDLDASPAELTARAQGKRRVFWVTWIHARTDPWNLVNFVLEKEGRKLEERPFTGYRVVSYAIPPNVVFDLDEMRPLAVDFDGQLFVDGVAVGGDGRSPVVVAGEAAWVSLRLRSQKLLQDDLKLFIYIRDDRGHIVGQDDRVLANRRQVRTPYWAAGDQTFCLALPRVASGTPPGRYQVEVGAYVDSTSQEMRRLGIVGGSGPLIVGELEVVRPQTPPPVASLVIGQPQRIAKDNLLFLGYDLPQAAGLPAEGTVAQGEVVPLILYWQAIASSTVDQQATLYLTADPSAERTAPASVETFDVGGRYPTSRWQAGEVVAEHHDFHISPATPGGSYQLVLALGDAILPLEGLRVIERARDFVVPDMGRRVGAVFGGVIELLGFDAPLTGEYLATVRPGGTLAFTLYWQAKDATTTSYKAFTHLLDGQNRVWGQKDSVPRDGASPTSSWLPGQVTTDLYAIVVGSNTPAGVYELEVGLYEPISGQRLRLGDGADRLVLGKVRVAP